MTLNFAFAVSSHLLILLGLIGLALTGELSWIYLLAAAAALAASGFAETRQGSGFLPIPWANAAMLVIFIVVIASIVLLKALPLQEIAHFLLALQSVKLLSVKRRRDWLQLYLLSFFSLIAATALSVEISTAVIFAFYLLWGPWVLVLFHLRHARDPLTKSLEAGDPWPIFPLFRLVAGMSLILLVLTLFFFVTLPRFGTGYFGDLWASGSAMTGFSDRLALGEIAAIKKNNATAMRVRVDRPDLLKRRALYWRGIALDHFDGRRWERDRATATLLRPSGISTSIDTKGGSSGPLIRQEILLEPTGSPTLFFIGRPLAFTGTPRTLLRDSLGNLRAAYPFPFQISYEVVSDLNSAPKHELPRENFLQLPDLDPRIGLLSRRVTEGIEGELQRARALEGYLRENYRYSLEGLPVSSDDPLGLFLFQVGQGDCEYFSSALAIMLRQMGIPSRVVNGYLGGEWNAYGDYYLVQQSHAHSWVEAYFDGAGWVTLDSTPAGSAGRPFSFLAPLSDFIDFLRLRWYRYVINFGLHDQYSLFMGLTRPHSWFHPLLPRFSMQGAAKRFLDSPQKWIGLGLLLLVIAAACLSHWRKKRSDAGFMPGAPSQATQRYKRFLTLAGKRGLRKKPGETPDEFSRTAAKLGESLVGEFTDLYQKARFYGPHPAETELQRMDRILTELER